MTTTPSPDHESTAAPVEPHRVLVLNSGSSSVKYQLLDMRDRSGWPRAWSSGSARRPRGWCTRR